MGNINNKKNSRARFMVRNTASIVYNYYSRRFDLSSG